MKILRSKIFIGLCLLFLALPFFINFLSCLPAPFESWKQPSNWTTFWGQYLSGFAAFAMLFVAWRTLLTTKDANRPYIVVDIVDRGYSRVFIRCRNLGHTIATNIKITLDNTFIEKIRIAKVKESVESINSTTPFVLEPNGEKVWEIFLIPGTQLDSFHNVWGENAKYPFKGEYILKQDWKENEKIFKGNILKCSVSYNDEYSEHIEIDYNNILDGITTDEKLSNGFFSIVMSLSHIQNELRAIKSAISAEQDKNTLKN
ncbi:hypothetical protein [Bacteroides acidifaciens]|uniref:hypothetical protein n=1 Tax=Bacteroides acidifaciens TaxID=85831 RepID=UPI002570428C|nr:hypothetical protein [Bacteroides acidifaciens]